MDNRLFESLSIAPKNIHLIFCDLKFPSEYIYSLIDLSADVAPKGYRIHLWMNQSNMNEDDIDTTLMASDIIIRDFSEIQDLEIELGEHYIGYQILFSEGGYYFGSDVLHNTILLVLENTSRNLPYGARFHVSWGAWVSDVLQLVAKMI